MFDVLEWYWQEYGHKLPYPSATRSALEYWGRYFDSDTSVHRLTPVRLSRFWDFLRTCGLKETTISRITGVGRTAINSAHNNGLIQQPPKIADNLTTTEKLDAPPMGRPLEPQELSALLAIPKPPFLHALMMIMSNTLCRTRAAIDLTPAQVDLGNGLVHLNPLGRRQTKKYRPTVPLTKTLRAFIEKHSEDAFVCRADGRVRDVYPEWREMLRAAGLKGERRVTPYSLRHTMARYLASQRAPYSEIALFLGHRRPPGESPMTVRYAPYRPDYLTPSANLIDRYFEEMPHPA